MEEYLKFAAQYGPMGLIALAMGWFIMYMAKSHKEERKELTDSLKSQHVEATTAINNNTTVLAELRTLISRNN